MRRTSVCFLSSLFAFLGLLALGCGGSAQGVDMGGPEGKLISDAVENINDSVNSSAKLSKSFAKGSTVPAVKKMNGLAFYVVGKPKVTGEEATCKIRIEKLADGKALGETDWTFVKEGADWKIKSAPLP